MSGFTILAIKITEKVRIITAKTAITTKDVLQHLSEVGQSRFSHLMLEGSSQFLTFKRSPLK